MKITPRPYYKCNYCNTTYEHHCYFKYYEGSGFQEIDYDICSEKCLEKHKDMLRYALCKTEKELNEHLKEFLSNGSKYNKEGNKL